MPEPSLQRLERSMKGLTIGVVKNKEAADKRAAQDGLTEREEQVHIQVSGRAEEFSSWQRKKVRFGTAFVDATGQRDSPFDRPHFTFGAVIETPDPVGIVACVMDWITTERNETIGAEVAIGVLGTDESVKFRGSVHCTFEGYGAPANTFDDSDLGAS